MGRARLPLGIPAEPSYPQEFVAARSTGFRREYIDVEYPQNSGIPVRMYGEAIFIFFIGLDHDMASFGVRVDNVLVSANIISRIVKGGGRMLKYPIVLYINGSELVG
jgi:hypothetical protein